MREIIVNMEGRIDPWLLWSRALILGVLATGLGTAGHVGADGMLPGIGTMVTLVAVMVALSALLLLRPASGVRLALSLAAGQSVVHVVLTAAAGHADGAPMSGMPGMSGGHEHTQSAATSMSALSDHLVGHAPMMTSHVAVAALLGLWLARGEDALWTLIALAARRLVVTPRVLAVVDVRVRRLTTPTPRPAGPRSLWQALPHARRGPPHVTAS